MWPGASQSSLYGAAATLVIAALTIAALYLGRAFIIPLAVAGFFSFVLQPAVRQFEQRGLPRAAGVSVVVLTLLLLLGLAATILAREVSHFAEELPRYEDNLRTKADEATRFVRDSRVWRGAAVLFRRTEHDAKSPDAEAPPLKVAVEDDKTSLLGRVALFLQLSLSPLASIGLALLFTFFILLQYHDLRDRVIRLIGSGEVARATQALNDAAAGLAHFFRLQVAINVSFGLLVGLCLWAIGVPNPPLWGALAALLRFVPYIGGIISAFLPLAVAAAVEPGWSKFILTAGLFAVAEFFVSQIVEPLLFGRRTQLSPLAVILAAAFWTTLWGPVGLLLAMPITLALVVFADHIPLLSFFRIMLGNEPALLPEERLYHRLLAGDASSAVDQVYDWVEEGHSLVEFLDRVAMPALAIAAFDQKRNVLRMEQLNQLKQATTDFVKLIRELIAELAEARSDTREGGRNAPERIQMVVFAARGPFDQAAAEVFCLVADLEGDIDVTCPAGGSLLAISAAATTEMAGHEIEFATLLSVGGATRPQLELLAKRVRQRLPLPQLRLFLVKPQAVSIGGTVREEQSTDGGLRLVVVKSSQALLDDIRQMHALTMRRGEAVGHQARLEARS